MIRALFAALLALLAIAAPAEAGRLKVHRAAQGAGVFATLAPGASFNGTPCSGYASGVCPNSDGPIIPTGCTAYGISCQDGSHLPTARVQAQPAIHWIVPSDLRLAADSKVCVDADAKGGIAYVRFHGEGNTVDVTTPGVITDTDANGNVRYRWGYCVTLDATAWKAKTTTGAGRLFAEAVANDAAMAHRIIGHGCIYTDGAARPYDTCQYAGNYPFFVYPRTAENDASYTICASGCDATTIKDAIDLACTAAKKAPLFTITQTAFYELVSRGVTCATSGQEGRAVLTTSSGVVATLGHATAYAGSETNAGNVWAWAPGWDGMELRGRGLVFDRKWLTGFSFDTKPPWFNGVKFTNSVGDRDTPYWSGGPPPLMQVTPAGYWDDAFVEYTLGITADQRYVNNTLIKQTGSHIMDGGGYAYGTYARYYSNQAIRGPTPSISIAYTGGGSTPTLTCDAPGGGSATNGVCNFKLAGVSQFTVNQGYYSTDSIPTITAFAAAVNGHAGWVATVMNGRGGFRPTLLGVSNVAYGPFSNVAISTNSGAPTTFITGYDIHAEWAHSSTGGYADGSLTARQNIIYRNNVVRDMVVGPFINNSALLSYDTIIKNNAFLGDPAALSDSTLEVSGPEFGGPTRSHYVFDHNTIEAWIIRIESTAGDTAFSEFKNNLFHIGFRSGGTAGTWSLDAPWINNVYAAASGDAMSGGGNTGNTAYQTGTASLVANFRALFTDWANGDFSAANGGVLALNLKAKAEDRDNRRCVRSDLDVAGAFSKNCPMPAWPF